MRDKVIFCGLDFTDVAVRPAPHIYSPHIFILTPKIHPHIQTTTTSCNNFDVIVIVLFYFLKTVSAHGTMAPSTLTILPLPPINHFLTLPRPRLKPTPPSMLLSQSEGSAAGVKNVVILSADFGPSTYHYGIWLDRIHCNLFYGFR